MISICRRYFLLVIALCSSGLYGQLFVDAGGPRNIFITAANDSNSKFLNFDSKTESISLNFLQLERNPSFGGWVFGGTLAGSSPNNNILNVFKNQVPTVTGSILANLTDYQGASKHSHWLTSATFKVSNAYASYALQNSTTSRSSTTTIDEPLGSVALALAFSDTGWLKNALCLTLAVTKGDNYQSLPQMSQSDGKTVRVGVLKTFTSFPMRLLYNREVGVDSGSTLDKVIDFANKLVGGGSTDATATVERFIEIAPYGDLAPRNRGTPSSGFGINLALKTHTDGANGKPGKFTFPWSFYIERTRKYDLSGYTTGGGVSTIFSF
jgi:hypothetical protein